MSDELPRGPRGPGMSHDFEQRMRRGLSTMAVRERVRERRRNRAIAGGAVAAAVVAVAAVIGGQALASLAPERDMAAPPAPTTTAPPEETAAPTTPEPTETAPAAPTPPPGFEGVAAGEPHVLELSDCQEGCGDAGAAGGGTGGLERTYDVYVLCEGSGRVTYGGTTWIDCSEFAPGSGWAQLGVRDIVGDGDPQFAAVDGFDGQLAVVDAGEVPRGSSTAVSATVVATCLLASEIDVDGVRLDCSGHGAIVEEMGVWGVAIAPGSFAPRIERVLESPAQVRWVVER